MYIVYSVDVPMCIPYHYNQLCTFSRVSALYNNYVTGSGKKDIIIGANIGTVLSNSQINGLQCIIS